MRWRGESHKWKRESAARARERARAEEDPAKLMGWSLERSLAAPDITFQSQAASAAGTSLPWPVNLPATNATNPVSSTVPLLLPLPVILSLCARPVVPVLQWRQRPSHCSELKQL